MEMYARWAHKALWHDFQPGWLLHKSHHVPRLGPFEANDIFAVVNAVPAMGLCLYGVLTPDLMGGLCFGAGLGITLFGIMYMYIHDGLVHRRFPVREPFLLALPALQPRLPTLQTETDIIFLQIFGSQDNRNASLGLRSGPEHCLRVRI